jgi:hypothetical protein
MLYLVDLKNGIFIFDNQGNYVKNIPIENAKNVKVMEIKSITQKTITYIVTIILLSQKHATQKHQI